MKEVIKFITPNQTLASIEFEVEEARAGNFANVTVSGIDKATAHDIINSYLELKEDYFLTVKTEQTSPLDPVETTVVTQPKQPSKAYFVSDCAQVSMGGIAVGAKVGACIGATTIAVSAFKASSSIGLAAWAASAAGPIGAAIGSFTFFTGVACAVGIGDYIAFKHRSRTPQLTNHPPTQ